MLRLFVIPVALAALIATGCNTAPPSEARREALKSDTHASLKLMQADDPSLQTFMDRAYGYAMFPSVGKGGFIVGGAWGRGEVYEGNRMIGYSNITGGSVGLQAGGQEFAELIVFENKDALDRFINNKFAFAANASAVAIKAGAAGTANFRDGVAVFVKPKGGLMAELSLGAQQFTFTPVDRVSR